MAKELLNEQKERDAMTSQLTKQMETATLKDALKVRNGHSILNTFYYSIKFMF